MLIRLEKELAPEPAGLLPASQTPPKVSFAGMSARKNYPGIHWVSLLVNGQEYSLGEFELSKP